MNGEPQQEQRCEWRGGGTAPDPCGAWARWRVERGRKYDGQYSCGRHLSATCVALLGIENRPLTVTPHHQWAGGPVIPAGAASAEFCRLPGQARPYAETRATCGHQVDDFFDLSPQERAEVYERAVQDYWGAAR